MEAVMKTMIWGLVIVLAVPALFAQEAVIREIRGTVEVKAPDAADWSPAFQGQAIGRSTLVSTGFKSGALIGIGNSTISVQSLTRLSLEELTRAESAEKVDISLRTGRVRANVKPPPGGTTSFAIRSPTATASVRGTSFEFNGTEVRVEEGRVHFAGTGGNGAYVGGGRLARTDSETGYTAGPAETAAEELTPPAPAGADSVIVPFPAKVLSSGDIDAWFDWTSSDKF
jgi:hypothetical protein